MKNANDFDCFIKIDADMIIEDSNFLDRLNKYLNDNKEVSRLVFPVFDYYTDEHILGVNVYRNYAKWDTDRNEQYFVDRIENPLTIKVSKNELLFFRNSISHCTHPNLQQTYMFGYHRTLKAFQPDKFLPKLTPANWNRFYYIYHNKLNIGIYHNVFRGINDALSLANSTRNNSYNLQFENSIKETKYSSLLSFLFSHFHPNLSYVLVYIYVRFKFVINAVFVRKYNAN